MPDIPVQGWKELSNALGCSAKTLQRYERAGLLPVHRDPSRGPKPHVFMLQSEIQDWLKSKTYGRPHETVVADIIKAYEEFVQTVFIDFQLRETPSCIEATADVTFFLKVTYRPERYTQEVRIGDGRNGNVSLMQLSRGGKPLYSISNPTISRKNDGSAIFRGPEVVLDIPKKAGFEYKGRVVWTDRIPAPTEGGLWRDIFTMPTWVMDVTMAGEGFEFRDCGRTGAYFRGAAIVIGWKRPCINWDQWSQIIERDQWSRIIAGEHNAG